MNSNVRAGSSPALSTRKLQTNVWSFFFISKLVLWFVLNLVRGLVVKVSFVNSESLGSGIFKNWNLIKYGDFCY